MAGPAEAGLERARDLERFLTFIDAAVAIALTLLVLPLVDLTVELRRDDSVANLLRNHGWQFFAFGLSFVVIARVWLGHHDVMRPVIASSTAVVLFSLLWLACVVFLPFPTALVATVGDQSLTRVLYFGTMAASGLSLTLLSWSVNRAPAIREPDPDYRDHVVSNAVITAYFVLALGVALLLPSLGYLALLLLFLTTPTVKLIRRRG